MQKAVADAMAARSVRTEITADQVLDQLKKLVFFDIRTLFDENGALKPIHKLDDVAAAALVSVESDELYDGVGKDRRFVGYTRKAKIADRVCSITLAMRHLKMLTDKVAVGGDGDNPNPIPVANTAVQYSALRERMTKYSEAKS
jgi:phage terminase small subunit